MIFDTHAHYDDERFNEDREAVLASLVLNGVDRVVNVAANMDSVETTLALAQKTPFMFAALGVHPDDVAPLSEADMEKIARYATTYGYKFAADKQNPGDKKVVAIGEIGLDYYGEGTEKSLQRHWFERQLQLSKELDLPVIIHSRDAAQETYEILKDGRTGDGVGVVHCYSYSKEMARQFLDLGYYIGLGGVVTFKNGRVAKEVAAYVPEDRLLLETDCPYLAPVPHRGERNDSANLKYVAAEIAALRGTTPEHIIEVTRENGNRFYRLEG